MTDREKLIELILKGEEAVPCYRNPDIDCSGIRCPSCEREAMADILIAHGVTFATDNNVGSKWISVEDEIPKGDCLVYDANGGKVRRGSGTEILAAADWHITHWMPMPTPPKED